MKSWFNQLDWRVWLAQVFHPARSNTLLPYHLLCSIQFIGKRILYLWWNEIEPLFLRSLRWNGLEGFRISVVSFKGFYFRMVSCDAVKVNRSNMSMSIISIDGRRQKERSLFKDIVWVFLWILESCLSNKWLVCFRLLWDGSVFKDFHFPLWWSEVRLNLIFCNLG